MDKNYSKYYSYSRVIDQIDAAIKAGFYLEAITIEESILTDRLYRFCKQNGITRNAERATLGDELRFFKSLSAERQQ